MPYDVICLNCMESHYETIDGKFDPNVLVSPDMIRMKNPWRDWNWSGCSHDPGAGHGQIVCLGCDAPLAPAGRLSLGEYRRPENKDRIGAEPGPAGNKSEPPPKTSDDGPPYVCRKCGLKKYRYRNSRAKHEKVCDGGN
jgi:hypothetical protein